MFSVWKFQLEVGDYIDIEMPIGAKILAFATQYEKMCLWCRVDPKNKKETRRFRLVGTGHDFNYTEGVAYIGTTQLQSGAFVFHLFERLGKE